MRASVPTPRRDGHRGVWVHALVDTRETDRATGPTRGLVAAHGQWARDAQYATRRLMRAPAMVPPSSARSLSGRHVRRRLHGRAEDPDRAEPYKDPDDLYFVWRDYGPIFDLKRGWLPARTSRSCKRREGNEAAVGLGRVSRRSRRMKVESPGNLGNDDVADLSRCSASRLRSAAVLA